VRFQPSNDTDQLAISKFRHLSVNCQRHNLSMSIIGGILEHRRFHQRPSLAVVACGFRRPIYLKLTDHGRPLSFTQVKVSCGMDSRAFNFWATLAVQLGRVTSISSWSSPLGSTICNPCSYIIIIRQTTIRLIFLVVEFERFKPRELRTTPTLLLVRRFKGMSSFSHYITWMDSCIGLKLTFSGSAQGSRPFLPAVIAIW